MLKRVFAALLAAVILALPAQAQDGTLGPIQTILQEHSDAIVKSSRKTIGPAIDAVAGSGLPQAQTVLQAWQAKDMWQRKADGLFFLAKPSGDGFALTDFDTGTEAGVAAKGDLEQIKPNAGIRALLGTALVQFQLLDPDRARRVAALTSVERDPVAELIEPLAGSIEDEPDAELKARKERLLARLTARFGATTEARVTAIHVLSGSLAVEARGVLNQVLTLQPPALAPYPEGAIVARTVTPGGTDLSIDAAYDLMVAAGQAQPVPTVAERLQTLSANIDGGRVGGVPVAQLNTQEARDRAYLALVAAGTVPATSWTPEFSKAESVAGAEFALLYAEKDAAVIEAARATLKGIERKVAWNQTLDLGLDALSLASIYFLAAIGLAITFGVMGVINMAHGEFIMMGAYTGYVVQQFIPNHTSSVLVAIPLAFAVTFAAGVAMERLVIRWLYNRPLETLLATFGISIALQQLFKNIFGTQARPLTAPDWLGGAWTLNDVVSISYIRIAIFFLALIFLGLVLFIMKRTRLGLETRAVTQNPGMAGAMGIRTDRVNMLTFGLGSGIAGIAGMAIGLFAKVTSELGSDYIVQSFMTVVVGGVGNIWGTLLGATLIGTLQKGIEWLNPSNTLAAQTYMIIFIIIFIQFRPRGIIALKGRAAGD